MLTSEQWREVMVSYEEPFNDSLASVTDVFIRAACAILYMAAVTMIVVSFAG